MPEANVQLTVEIETTGAEKLTTLRRDLEAAGKAGQQAFTGLDRSLRAAFDQHRRLAGSIGPLFRDSFGRILSDARGFGDAFKRLFSDLRNSVAGTIARMVADWLGGLRHISSGAPGGASLSLAGASPLSSFLPGRSLTSGSGAASDFTPFGGAFGSGRNVRVAGGLALQGGLALGIAGVRSGNPFLGAAGGALAGFAAGGPVGLALGLGLGVFGGIIGRLGRGRRNRRDAGLAENLFAGQLRSIFTEFELRRLDAEAALTSIDNALSAFTQAARGFGRPGGRALGRGRSLADEFRERIEALAGIRASRASLIASGPLVEFRHGGFDPFGGVRRLHPGEFVMRPEAVRAIGRDTLERANSAAGGQPVGGTNITIHVHPSPGMDERALAREIRREFKRIDRDRGVRA